MDRCNQNKKPSPISCSRSIKAWNYSLLSRCTLLLLFFFLLPTSRHPPPRFHPPSSMPPPTHTKKEKLGTRRNKGITAKWQKKINSYTTVYQRKKEKTNWNQVSPENIGVKTLRRQYDRLKISNGMVYREWIDVTGI